MVTKQAQIKDTVVIFICDLQKMCSSGNLCICTHIKTEHVFHYAYVCKQVWEYTFLHIYEWKGKKLCTRSTSKCLLH